MFFLPTKYRIYMFHCDLNRKTSPNTTAVFTTVVLSLPSLHIPLSLREGSYKIVAPSGKPSFTLLSVNVPSPRHWWQQCSGFFSSPFSSIERPLSASLYSRETPVFPGDEAPGGPSPSPLTSPFLPRTAQIMPDYAIYAVVRSPRRAGTAE